jgi:hypothetical protein
MIGKIQQNIDELGVIDTVFYVLQRLFANCGLRLLRYALVAQPVTPDRRLNGRRGASMTTREIGPEDPVLKALPLEPDVIAYRHAQGAHCLGLFLDDKMIGCLWLCFDPYDEDEVRCRFIPYPADKAGWDFDVFLLPEYRGGLGFLRLWDAGNAFLRERGREWSCSRISVFNKPSILAHKSMGAQVLGTATFLVLGRYQLMLSTLSPFCDVSSQRGKGPRLVLRAPVEGA